MKIRQLLTAVLLLAALWCPVAARTQAVGCTITSLPYQQSFDGWTSVDPCWDTHCADGTFSLYADYARTGNSLAWPSSPQANMMTLPRVAAPLNTLTLSFWVYVETFYTGQLLVGYTTDSARYDAFVAVDSIAVPSQQWGVWVHCTVDYSALPDTAEGRLCFYKPGRYLNNGIYMDDLVVSVPGLCGDVADLRVATLGATTAGLTWRNTAGVEGAYSVH
mgnify:CR=1 FL=1